MHHVEERPVDEEDVVRGVVDDVGEVVREETVVDRVQDPPRAGHGHVQLQVALRVPSETPHPGAGGDAQVIQHSGEASDALGDVAVGSGHRAAQLGRGDVFAAEPVLHAVHEHRQ
ncbi:hypothetical protein SHIRM173S_08758 [Streptomyces hirsutus]